MEIYGRPMLRSVEDRASVVKESKDTWFRHQGATATIQVPCTPDSKLATMIKKTLMMAKGPLGTSVKVVERPGAKIHTGLSMNDPFKRESCQRRGCPYMESGRKCRGQCYKEGFVYLAECKVCSTSTTQVYTGESSRTLYTRCQQHLSDYRRIRNGSQGESVSSWIHDHVEEHHPQVKDEFNPLTDIKWSVRSTHRDPLTRQTTEAVLIQEATETGTLTKGGGKVVHVTSMNRKR